MREDTYEAVVLDRVGHRLRAGRSGRPRWSADTLVLRNGNRISGRLIGLRDGVFEFEEDRGNRRRVVRVEQVDVRTIELDQDGPRAFDRGNNEPAARGRAGCASAR